MFNILSSMLVFMPETFYNFLIKEEEREESMKKEGVEKDGNRILPGFLDKYNERA